MTNRPILDWVSRHDEKSKDYPIRATIGAVEPKTRLWREGSVFDQGQEGACVGFAWTGELAAYPHGSKISAPRGNQYALDVYNSAKRIDEWAGENYSGTSVLAGAKVLQSRGLIGSYRWAFSVEDVRDTLVTTGPVVIGIPWYDGMYETRPSGLVQISGPVVGGHAILLTGYYKSKTIEGKRLSDVVRWRNSWGAGYGYRGSGYIKLEDLAGLLKDNGEACVPLDRKPVKL